MEIFASIINTSRRPIMCYHATRLTKEEIIQINRDGIIPYNRETLKLKLDLL